MSSSGYYEVPEFRLLYWLPLALAVPLAVGRYAIRLQVHGRIYADDVAHFIALACTIVYMGVGFVYIGRWSSMLSGFLYFGGLGALKISFLLLYRDVFWVSTRFRKYWFVTAGLAIASIVTTLGVAASAPHEYSYNDDITSSAEETEELAERAFTLRFIIAACIDVVPSLMIIGVPIWIFPGLHLRHSLNWYIALVYFFGLGGFALQIMSSVGGGLGPVYNWVLCAEGWAASMAAYGPLVLPKQKRLLWPWSRKPPQVPDKSPQDTVSGSRGVSSGRVRSDTSNTTTSLMPRYARVNEDEFEMNDLRSPIGDISAQKVLPYHHIHPGGLDTDL